MCSVEGFESRNRRMVLTKGFLYREISFFKRITLSAMKERASRVRGIGTDGKSFLERVAVEGHKNGRGIEVTSRRGIKITQ